VSETQQQEAQRSTYKERTALIEAVYGPRDDVPSDPDEACDAVIATYDRLLSARLTPIEALADEWERQATDPDDPAYKIGLFSAAAEVRDALAAHPVPPSVGHTEAEEAGK
jgi:hypothetical protein